MGATNLCAGSAVFIVNLDRDDQEGIEPGTIYGATTNGGPITIVDTVVTREAVTTTITKDDGTTETVTTQAATKVAGHIHQMEAILETLYLLQQSL